ncbi:hypothetical protein, partial [Pseudomonas tohonis]|uniref:hypothetical protein n=1 Tax=Pseudomonas tohonis TaxID=2725477 RepID=UPI001F33B5C6
WDAMAAIIANGTADQYEPPTYAQQLVLANHRADVAERERDQLRAELEAIRGQEPFWYAVISERAPVIDKAIRREDVAMEYAEKASATYYGVEVVPLYRLQPQQPDAVSVPRELAERVSVLFPLDMDDDGSGRAGFYPHVIETVRDFRALLSTKNAEEGSDGRPTD